LCHFLKNNLSVDLNYLDLEWRLLRNTQLDISLEIEDFWASVKKIQNGNELETFPLINNLVFYILTLHIVQLRLNGFSAMLI